jgi:hypothetical protein
MLGCYLTTRMGRKRVYERYMNGMKKKTGSKWLNPVNIKVERLGREVQEENMMLNADTSGINWFDTDTVSERTPQE